MSTVSADTDDNDFENVEDQGEEDEVEDEVVAEPYVPMTMAELAAQRQSSVSFENAVAQTPQEVEFRGSISADGSPVRCSTPVHQLSDTETSK